MRAEQYALENNKLLVGVFHSHPDHPPRPSARDLEDALPEFSYFITSVHQGQALDTRSWRLSEQRVFQEETIQINYHTNN
jgi:proteasome lid subunit RPN8/RPN11